jgi:hypothetical protein
MMFFVLINYSIMRLASDTWGAVGRARGLTNNPFPDCKQRCVRVPPSVRPATCPMTKLRRVTHICNAIDPAGAFLFATHLSQCGGGGDAVPLLGTAARRR